MIAKNVVSSVEMTRIHTAEGVKWQISVKNDGKTVQEEVYNSNAEALRDGVLFAAAESTTLQVVPWPEMEGEAEELLNKGDITLGGDGNGKDSE